MLGKRVPAWNSGFAVWALRAGSGGGVWQALPDGRGSWSAGTLGRWPVDRSLRPRVCFSTASAYPGPVRRSSLGII